MDFDEKSTGDGLWSDILASFKLKRFNDDCVSYKLTASLRYEDFAEMHQKFVSVNQKSFLWNHSVSL